MCGVDLVELCDVWESLWNCVMFGEIWWNCVMCGAQLVELCDVWGDLVELCDVWGKFVGIV